LGNTIVQSTRRHASGVIPSAHRQRIIAPIGSAICSTPEVLYCIGLAVVMLAGSGPWGLDAKIATLLAT
jgi:hypothetical protein